MYMEKVFIHVILYNIIHNITFLRNEDCTNKINIVMVLTSSHFVKRRLFSGNSQISRCGSSYYTDMKGVQAFQLTLQFIFYFGKFIVVS